MADKKIRVKDKIKEKKSRFKINGKDVFVDTSGSPYINPHLCTMNNKQYRFMGEY